MDKLINFIHESKVEIEFIHRISNNIFLIKTNSMVIVIPSIPNRIGTVLWMNNCWERLLCLEEMRMMVKAGMFVNSQSEGIIMSNHRSTGWLDPNELLKIISKPKRINAEISGENLIIFVHFIKFSGKEISDFINKIGFSKIKIVDYENAVISWITSDSEQNSPTYQLYNLGSDLVGKALIIKKLDEKLINNFS